MSYNPLDVSKGWNIKIIDETVLDPNISITDAGCYIDVQCSVASGNITSQLYVATKPASIRIKKSDNTNFTHTSIAGTGQSIKGYPDGITLTSEGQWYEINYLQGDDNAWVVSASNIASVISRNALNLTGNSLTSSVNGVVSNSVNVQPLITTPTANNIVTVNSSGQVVDSGKAFGNDGTNNTVATSAQMQSYVVQQLLNIPNLGAVPFSTVSNDSLSGLVARDGYTPTAGDVCLVKNQTIAANNGFWITASGAWTRAYFNTSTNTFSAITTQTTYADLNINSGIINVLNGTVNKNLQYQIIIINSSATFGNTSVIVTATTKIPSADPSQRFINTNIGNDTNNNGSQSFPYLTITKGLVGASYPQIMSVSGQTISDNITFASGNSNITIQTLDQAIDAGKIIITGAWVTTTNFTRGRFIGLTFSTGSNVCFTLGASDAGRHTFQNCVFQTTNTSLISIASNGSNWITLNNPDATGSPLSALTLPNVSSGTRYLYLQNVSKRFTINGVGTGWIVIIEGSCSKGAVVFKGTTAGTVIDRRNYLLNALLTSQAQLTALLSDTNVSTDGYYTTNFASPSIGSTGDILLKQSIQGVATDISVTCPYAQAGGAISIYVAGVPTTYIQTSLGWSIPTGGSGTVSSVSVASANGFAGSVANPTTTPAITLSTNITGVLKGDGTAINQAIAGTDYSLGTASLITGILKSTTSTGALSIAAAGDFPTLNQNTTGSAGSVSGTNVITNANLSQVDAYTLKGNNTNATANVIDLTADQTLNTINNGTSTTNALAINRGGTNTRTQTANGINYFDGTKITSNANLNTDGNGNIGITGNNHLIGSGNGTTTTLPVVIAGSQNTGANSSGTITQFQASNGTQTGGSGSIRFQTADSNLPIFIGGYNQSFTSATSFTFAYTMPSFGINKMLVLELVYGANTAGDASSITYAGTALTQLVTIPNATLGSRTSIWYLTNPSSSGNIVITIPVATTLSVQALAFANVNQINGFTSSTTASTSATATPSSGNGSSANDLVLDFLTIANSTTLTSFGTGQTIINTDIGSSATTNTYSSIKTGTASTTTMSATLGASVNQTYIVCTLRQYVPTPVLLGYLPQTATNVATYSFAYNTTSLYKNQAMVLQIVYTTNTGADANAITYTVGNLTQTFTLGLSNANASLVRSSVWYLTAPNIGTGTINITLPATASMYIVANTYYNVDQTTPLYGFAGTNGNTSPMSGTVTTAINDLAIDLAVVANNTVLTAGIGETPIFNATNGTLNIYSAYRGASATSTSLSYSFTGTQNYNYIRYGLRAFNTYSYNSLQDNLILSRQNNVQVAGTIRTNTIIPAFVSTATVIGSNKLTAFSNQVQIFTGSSAQDVFLPDATTLSVGQTFKLINNCNTTIETAIVYVYKSNNFSLATNTATYYLIPGAVIYATCIDNTTVGGTWYFEAVNQYYTKTSTITGNTNLTVSTTLTSMPGLSFILPYIGTYRLSYNVTSYQQSDSNSTTQRGAYFQFYNNTTATEIVGSNAYGSSTDIENSSGSGFSSTGCASVSVYHTTTTINNTIVIRGALDTTAAILSWRLNSANGDSTMTAELISMPFVK